MDVKLQLLGIVTDVKLQLRLQLLGIVFIVQGHSNKIACFWFGANKKKACGRTGYYYYYGLRMHS